MSSSYLAARLQIEDDLRRDERLTQLARNVAIELVRRRHASTGKCNISIPKIAEALHCASRSIDRALVALVSSGWIEKTSGKGRSSNSYVFPRLDRTPAHADGPGADTETLSRQNVVTTESVPCHDDVTTPELSRQDVVTGDLLSRHFDNVVTTFSTPLSRQNVVQSLLRNSLKDLTPKAPSDEAVTSPASGGCRTQKLGRSKKPPSPGQLRPAFERFWKAWPHRVGKPTAIKAFAKHVDKIDDILAGVDRYIRDKPADRQWLNPATFLNQERWKDQPAPLNGAPPSAPASPDDPEVLFPGGYKRRESVLRDLVARHARKPRDWPPVLGPAPGEPGCLVPKHLLAGEAAAV